MTTVDAIDNDEFRRRVEPVARFLRRVPEQLQTMADERGWAPADSSVAETEWRLYRRHAGFSGAFTMLSAARDHMHGASELIGSDRIYIWAPMPLGRAAVEAAARVWWLCDPDLTAEARLSRGYELWRLALGDTARIPDLVEQDQLDLHGQLAGRMADQDVTHTVKAGRVTKVDSASWPGAREVLKGLYGDESFSARVYSWLSGVAHGDPWILSESFRGEDAEEGRRLLHTGVETSRVAVLAKVTVVAYVRAVDRWSTLMGWSDDWEPWSRWFPKRADELVAKLT